VDQDPQLILPTLILERMPLVVQVLFFGALLSAILSTAGGALLAPAVVVAENLVRPLMERRGAVLDERRQIRVMRGAVLAIGLAVLGMALASNQSIYDLVNNSGKVVLVAAFVPLTAGLFWKRATTPVAAWSIGLGLVTWIDMEWTFEESVVPPPLAGLIASTLGMVAGSLAPARRPA
jgi:Na+/proline symporter